MLSLWVARAFPEACFAPTAVAPFTAGLVGFPNAKRFVAGPPDATSSSPLLWLKSIEQPEQAFLNVGRQIVVDNYMRAVESLAQIAAQQNTEVAPGTALSDAGAALSLVPPGDIGADDEAGNVTGRSVRVHA